MRTDCDVVLSTDCDLIWAFEKGMFSHVVSSVSAHLYILFNLKVVYSRLGIRNYLLGNLVIYGLGGFQRINSLAAMNELMDYNESFGMISFSPNY